MSGWIQTAMQQNTIGVSDISTYSFAFSVKKMLQVTLKMITKLIWKNSSHFNSRFYKRYTLLVHSDKIKMTQNDYLITVLELDKSSSDFK